MHQRLNILTKNVKNGRRELLIIHFSNEFKYKLENLGVHNMIWMKNIEKLNKKCQNRIRKQFIKKHLKSATQHYFWKVSPINTYDKQLCPKLQKDKKKLGKEEKNN